MPQQIVDACCLINLYASGSMLDILRAIVGGIYVPVLVTHESLFVRKEDDQDPTALVPDRIDLTHALAAGLLHQCDLENEVEAEYFVQFAAGVDDGEAMCLALAKCRQWTVATDDRKAIRVAITEGIDTISTAEIVKFWADKCKVADEALAESLRRIERYARFRPRKGSPLQKWWTTASLSPPTTE